MTKKSFYCQCQLRKQAGDTTLEQVSHIPEQYCTVGRVLELRNSAGEWDDGWVVASVGERKAADLIEAHSRDFLKTRQASDV